MQKKISQFKDELADLTVDYEKELRDNKSLRKQLNEKMEEVRKFELNAGSPSSSNLNHLHILKSKDYPCDKCKFVNKGCVKLSFANQTICVCDEKDIKDFYK